MDYLTDLVEIGNKLRQWEVGTANTANYILSDAERKGSWLEEGKVIEKLVFESHLDQEEKARMFDRINSSYNLVNKPATENTMSKYSPYILGFLAGLYFVNMASNFSKKIEDNLAEKILSSLEKELGDKIAGPSNP